MACRIALLAVLLTLAAVPTAGANWEPHGPREHRVLAAALDKADGWRAANPDSIRTEVPGCWGYAPGKWGCIARLWFPNGSVCVRYTVEREIFVDRYTGKFVRRGRDMAVSEGGDSPVECAGPVDLSYGARPAGRRRHQR